MKTTDTDSMRQYILDNLTQISNLISTDQEIIQALVNAQTIELGLGRDDENVIDLRQSLIKRLDKQLDQLSKKHKSVLSLVYDNVTTTRQIHRAILALLPPRGLGEFVKCVNAELPEILNVSEVRVCLEVGGFSAAQVDALKAAGGNMTFMPIGNVSHYIAGKGEAGRVHVLRGLANGHEQIYPKRAAAIRSEAALKLHLGEDAAGKKNRKGGRNYVGMLVLGSEDEEQFSPKMASDLLLFFAAIFEHILNEHLHGTISKE